MIKLCKQCYKKIFDQIIGYLEIIYSMKILHILLLVLIAFGKLCAQENLISNSDFEKHKDLPTDIGQGKNCLENWINPVLTGGGDYFHAEAKSKKSNTNKNFFGKQEPHSGKAYAGICITRNYREYLQTQLIKPLEKGRSYQVEVYISRGDAKWLGSMKGFCIVFSPDTFRLQKYGPPMSTPSLVFRNEAGYNNSEEWTLLSAVYDANGTEKYLTFGCFVYREKTEFTIMNFNVEIPGKRNYAHYFIDDFMLTPLDIVKTSNELIDKKIAANESPKVYETGKPHIFKNIVFESGKSDLLPSSYTELNQLAEYLINNPDVKANIIGHTDNLGNKEDNLVLSKNRAEKVLNFLIEKNISLTKLSFSGMGDSQPISSNISEEGRQNNRRVEVVFY